MALSSLPERNFRVGDRVRVKSRDAILSTLDERGEVNGMPFMPEMLEFCGRSFVVSKRADKTCDTAQKSGLRRMNGTVHLEDLRCDGSAHGGCQNNCLLFWREEWLVSDPTGQPSMIVAGGEQSHDPRPSGETSAVATVETLTRAAIVERGDRDEAVRYACQATRVPAASERLSIFDLNQYVHDVVSGNTSTRRVIKGLAISLFNKYQDVTARILPRRLRIRDGLRYPFIAGKLGITPREELGLEPGDLVQIKSLGEIVATLDKSNCNRGMLFDGEMVKYCGRFARVKSRIERIIDEGSGRMIHLRNDCVVLDSVVCDGDLHRFCPRAIYPFWREIWLRKISEDRLAADHAQASVDPTTG